MVKVSGHAYYHKVHNYPNTLTRNPYYNIIIYKATYNKQKGKITNLIMLNYIVWNRYT